MHLSVFAAFVVDDFWVEVFKQCPTLGICLVISYFAYGHICKEHKAHIASKDKEIKRLVEEKNYLQEQFLRQRLSTDEGGKSSEKAGKKKK